MKQEIYNAFIKLLKMELVPALGCTEPIAIAFTAAKARKTLGAIPEKISIGLSGNMIKNVQSVKVPNSGGLRGIDIAAGMGVFGGNPDKELEVLTDITEDDINKAKQFAKEKRCETHLVENKDNLYIDVVATKGKESAKVIVSETHTNIILIEKNGKTIFEKKSDKKDDSCLPPEVFTWLTIKNLYEFANTVDLNDIKETLVRAIKYNTAISQEGLNNLWGAGVGKTIMKYHNSKDVRVKAVAAAAAGSDARMSGCSLPVVINSGSGNQGITITLPIVEYAKYLKVSDEKLLRALALANLISMEEKTKIGSLSAYCGAVCAGTAAGCGIAYLHGGTAEDIEKVIANSLANVGGIVCDGAKPSCAAKIASSVSSGIFAFELGMKEKRAFQNGEGLIKKDADSTILSFGRMAKYGMKSTDNEILNIMLEK